MAHTADQGMSRSLSAAISMMLETETVTLEELLDARVLLEVPLAGLAAYRPEEATIERLRAAIATSTPRTPTTPMPWRWPTPRSTRRSPRRPATG